MKHVVRMSALTFGLVASQSWAECEKTAYIESVRAYSGDASNHIFVREKGIDSPIFASNTTDASILQAALQAHVNRMPVTIITVAATCPAPAPTGQWANMGRVSRLIVAP